MFRVATYSLMKLISHTTDEAISNDPQRAAPDVLSYQPYVDTTGTPGLFLSLDAV